MAPRHQAPRGTRDLLPADTRLWRWAEARALQVLERSQRRLAMLQCHVQPGGQQVVADRIQPLRAFRVPGPHVVDAAVGVAEEGSAHEA